MAFNPINPQSNFRIFIFNQSPTRLCKLWGMESGKQVSKGAGELGDRKAEGQ